MRCRRATPDDIDALVGFPEDSSVMGPPRDQVREDFDFGRMRSE